ncbi:MAG: hypothetical protein AB8B93_18735 [Pseudomonadales bacterium]
MSVDTFDPTASPQSLTDADVQTLLAGAGQLETPQFGFSTHEIARLGRLASTDAADWAAATATLTDTQLEALIRLLVLAEAALPGWESGAKSPVIVLARGLKSRSAWPDALTAWIRGNSRNRFLPHGSLMDRL